MDRSPDLLVVGAGPTGLALAAQAHAHGAVVRVVDRAPTPVHESRALAVQPRSLEVLRGTGVSERLLARGNSAARVVLHGEGATARVRLFDLGVTDTAYPFLLMVSQAETEAALVDHLRSRGVEVDRHRELVGLDVRAGGALAHVQGPDGVERIEAPYVVGCDGARSAVRRLAGIPFEGSAYPQAFALADLEIDGDLEPGAMHTWFTGRGLLFLFPLGTPATWRLVTVRASGPAAQELPPISLPELQRLVDGLTGAALRLRDPVWLSDFRIALRQAAAYRSGPVLLAGDAAHVHSPAGGQGMNTGIQDAWNLGWKLALVARGRADEALLDTYAAERGPAGQDVLEFTDRLVTIATSGRLAGLRSRVAPRLAPLVMRLPVRASGFRRVGQLAVTYRSSPLSLDEAPASRRGLHAGDRLPDARVLVAGRRQSLHELVALPGLHVLLVGDAPAPDLDEWADLVRVHRIEDARPRGRYLVVRPDGHVGYLGSTAGGVGAYLRRWLRPG